VPFELAERLSTALTCRWYSNTPSGELEAVVLTAYPGGGWDFDRNRSTVERGADLTELTVDGATAAVTGIAGIRPDGSYLLATDGVNLLRQLEAPDPGAAGAAFLAGLSAGG
jgi:hypothetical protein